MPASGPITGIDQIPYSESILIYPNPVEHFLQLSIVDEGTADIFDVAGRIVIKNYRLYKGLNTIDVRTLRSGIYILNLQLNSGGLYRWKFQVK